MRSTSLLAAEFGNVAMTVVIMATAPISAQLFGRFGPRTVLTVDEDAGVAVR